MNSGRCTDVCSWGGCRAAALLHCAAISGRFVRRVIPQRLEATGPPKMWRGDGRHRGGSKQSRSTRSAFKTSAVLVAVFACSVDTPCAKAKHEVYCHQRRYIRNTNQTNRHTKQIHAAMAFCVAKGVCTIYYVRVYSSILVSTTCLKHCFEMERSLYERS